jgi:hypothetical protein
MSSSEKPKPLPNFEKNREASISYAFVNFFDNYLNPFLPQKNLSITYSLLLLVFIVLSITLVIWPQYYYVIQVDNKNSFCQSITTTSKSGDSGPKKEENIMQLEYVNKLYKLNGLKKTNLGYFMFCFTVISLITIYMLVSVYSISQFSIRVYSINFTTKMAIIYSIMTTLFGLLAFLNVLALLSLFLYKRDDDFYSDEKNDLVFDRFVGVAQTTFLINLLLLLFVGFLYSYNFAKNPFRRKTLYGNFS